LVVDFPVTNSLASIAAKLSLLAAGVLLLANQFVPAEMHGWLSSLPLLLAGLGYALLQFRPGPSRRTILKRLLLAGAFVGWGIDQVLPSGRIAIFLGDAVIAAYVVDLYWMSADQNNER
jgi:uncharacterized membrane protein HdeD (DUF308 family)